MMNIMSCAGGYSLAAYLQPYCLARAPRCRLFQPPTFCFPLRRCDVPPRAALTGIGGAGGNQKRWCALGRAGDANKGAGDSFRGRLAGGERRSTVERDEARSLTSCRASIGSGNSTECSQKQPAAPRRNAAPANSAFRDSLSCAMTTVFSCPCASGRETETFNSQENMVGHPIPPRWNCAHPPPIAIARCPAGRHSAIQSRTPRRAAPLTIA